MMRLLRTPARTGTRAGVVAVVLVASGLPLVASTARSQTTIPGSGTTTTTPAPSTTTTTTTTTNPTTTPASTTTAPPAPQVTVLDEVAPWALAANGSRVAWVSDAGRGRQSLVVRDTPTGADRVLVRRLPFHATHLTLGTDARGRTVAIIERDGTPDTAVGEPRLRPARHGELWTVAVDGASHRPRRLRASRGPGSERAPGLYRGVLTFARTELVAGRGRTTVRRGRLDSRKSQLVARVARRQEVVATAVGARGRVMWTTHTQRPSSSDPVAVVNAWELRALAPNGRSERVAYEVDNTDGFNAYGPLTVDPAGRAVTVSVANGEFLSDHPRGARSRAIATNEVQGTGNSRIRTYDLRRRTVLSRTYSVDDVSVPVTGGGVVGFDAPELHDCPTRSRPGETDDDCVLAYAPPVDRTPAASASRSEG